MRPLTPYRGRRWVWVFYPGLHPHTSFGITRNFMGVWVRFGWGFVVRNA